MFSSCKVGVLPKRKLDESPCVVTETKDCNCLVLSLPAGEVATGEEKDLCEDGVDFR